MTRQLPRFCMYQIIERPAQIAEDFAKNSVTAEVLVLICGKFLFFNLSTYPSNNYHRCYTVYLFLVNQFAERPQRIALWLNQSLILPEEFEIKEDKPNNGAIEMWLRGMRDNKIHCFMADATGKVTVQTEDSTFAGDIIQSLALYLGLRELSSEVSFPVEEKKMLDALEHVKGDSK